TRRPPASTSARLTSSSSERCGCSLLRCDGSARSFSPVEDDVPARSPPSASFLLQPAAPAAMVTAASAWTVRECRTAARRSKGKPPRESARSDGNDTARPAGRIETGPRIRNGSPAVKSPAWPGVPYARGMSNRPESGDEPRGSADDVALATDGDRLWICASWSSLDGEEVWLGEVTGGSLGALVRAGDGDRPWFRPAVAALPGGALGLALSPGGWMAGTVVRDRRPPLRWEAEVDGAPWHAAVAGCRERGAVWLGLEVR